MSRPTTIVRVDRTFAALLTERAAKAGMPVTELTRRLIDGSVSWRAPTQIELRRARFRSEDDANVS